MDATGRVLGPAGGTVLPLVTGFAASIPGRQLSGPARPALIVAAALPSNLEPSASSSVSGGVRQISVGSGGQVQVTWGTGLQVVLGPPTGLPAKFDALATLVAKADLTGASRIDLTLPSQPTVAP
ncbi:MAG: cell division protein FtsQ/DivIB [Acidimicrobiales bacterium]